MKTNQTISATEKIFESEQLTVFWQESKQNNINGICYTFCGRDEALANKTSAPWGGKFLSARGYHVIGFVPKGANWYQSLLTDDSIELTTEFLKKKCIDKKLPRISYGTSMGAYAAIKYASRLECDICISLSPITRIKSDLTKSFNNDLPSEIERIKAKDVDPTTRVLVAFDPLSSDDIFFEEIASTIKTRVGIQSLKVKHAGHPVTTLLNESGMLKMVFDGFTRENQNLDLRISWKEKVQSKKWLKNYIKYLDSKHRFKSATRLIYHHKRTIALDDGLAKAALRTLRKSKHQGRLTDILSLGI